MPISVLPTTTVSAIGSSQSLTDPCSLVKELIDNALDARATSIAIEISANCLDIIQLKDNGCGIAEEDFGMVCKPNCTSKITTLEDLRKLGGKSLGFRGQALASAIEMSGGLKLTTKTDKKNVAKVVDFEHNGDVLRIGNSSHPTGTTVRVTDFLKTIPVRRQTALKSAQKSLAKIKRTLQAYAIARPRTKLTLRVFKLTSDNGNWSYGALSNAGMMEAALQVVGRDVACQCLEMNWPSNDASTALSGLSPQPTVSGEIHGDVTYEIHALLPSPTSDFRKISGKGQFVSVDGRPVTCSKGTLKEIVKLYKTYIKSHAHPSISLTDPFLCLSLKCSPGSYDPNVEPAKDDVLFVDSKNVLRVAEGLFKSVYGEIRAGGSQEDQKSPSSRSNTTKTNSFELLLARRPRDGGDFVQNDPHPSASQRDISRSLSSSCLRETDIQAPHQPQLPKLRPMDSNDDEAARPFGCRNMMHSTDDEHMLSFSGQNSRQIILDKVEDDPDELRDIRVTNPWTIAKMNSAIRPSWTKSTTTDHNCQLPTPTRDGQKTAPLRSSAHTICRTTPGRLGPKGTGNPISPLPSPRHESPHGIGALSIEPWDSVSLADSGNNVNQSARAMYDVGALDPGTKDPAFPTESPRETSHIQKTFHRIEGHPEDFVASSSPFDASQVDSSVKYNSQRLTLRKTSITSRPFKSPLKRLQHSDAEARQPVTVIQGSSNNKTSIEASSPSPTSPGFTNIDNGHPDLERVMDFERRKKAAAEQRKLAMTKDQRRNAILSRTDSLIFSQTHQVNHMDDDVEVHGGWMSSTPQLPVTSRPKSPHHNRYITAKAALSSDQTSAEATRNHSDKKTSYDNKNNSGNHLKIRRTKTSKLPLETIPTESETHNQVTTIKLPSPEITQRLLPRSLTSALRLAGITISEDNYDVRKDSTTTNPTTTMANATKFPGFSQKDFADLVSDWKWEDWGEKYGLIQTCKIPESVEMEIRGSSDMAPSDIIRSYFLNVGGS